MSFFMVKQMNEKLKIGDKVRVGPGYHLAEVVAIDPTDYPRPGNEQYSIRWAAHGGVGMIDRCFCVDWRKVLV